MCQFILKMGSPHQTSGGSCCQEDPIHCWPCRQWCRGRWSVASCLLRSACHNRAAEGAPQPCPPDMPAPPAETAKPLFGVLSPSPPRTFLGAADLALGTAFPGPWQAL